MRKTIYPFLGIGLCLLANLSYGQLASWPLTADAAGVSSNANIVVEDLTAGPGIGTPQFDATQGAQVRGWTTDPVPNDLDYLEFCVSTNGGTPNFTTLQFEVWQDANGPTRFDVLASTDGFVTSDFIFSTGVGDPGYSPVVSLFGSSDNVDYDICGGTQLCFRIYAYEAVSAAGYFGIRPNSLVVNGAFPGGCVPPTQQAVITGFSDVTPTSMKVQVGPGNGQGRLVAVKAGSPVTSRPCDGITYGSSPNLGNPSPPRLADGSQVIATGLVQGNLSIVGLQEGTTYHFAVFELANTNCYNVAPAAAIQTTSCSVPTDVSNVSAEIADKKVTLHWTVPMCNEVMIVASTAPVTGTPSGTGGNYDPEGQYGAGTDLNNPQHFSAPEYIVYKDMNNVSATVSGLTNGVTYYFKLFSRLGVVWSGGVEISATPTDGCPELGGYETVFINEVDHYTLNPNHGIELIGPAGTDLSDYLLILYDLEGMAYDTIVLNGVIPNMGNSGFGVRWFAFPGLEEGNGGIALYNEETETVLQFLSYRGEPITAIESVAEGMTADPIGGVFRTGASLQLIGEGDCPSDFIWQVVSPPTHGQFNNGQTALPVELIYFRGRSQDDFVRLLWQTATEVNNDYFSVERSADGRQFAEIDQVAGAGTTQEVQNYTFDDREPLPGINYYRLRQVDFDGAFAYSPVVAVAFRSDENALILYPTLGSGQLTVALAKPLEEQGLLHVFDLSGRLVDQRALPIDFQNEDLDFSALPPGAYLLQLQTDREWFSRRFIRQ